MNPLFASLYPDTDKNHPASELWGLPGHHEVWCWDAKELHDELGIPLHTCRAKNPYGVRVVPVPLSTTRMYIALFYVVSDMDDDVKYNDRYLSPEFMFELDNDKLERFLHLISKKRVEADQRVEDEATLKRFDAFMVKGGFANPPTPPNPGMEGVGLPISPVVEAMTTLAHKHFHIIFRRHFTEAGLTCVNVDVIVNMAMKKLYGLLFEIHEVWESFEGKVDAAAFLTSLDAVVKEMDNKDQTQSYSWTNWDSLGKDDPLKPIVGAFEQRVIFTDVPYSHNFPILGRLAPLYDYFPIHMLAWQWVQFYLRTLRGIEGESPNSEANMNERKSAESATPTPSQMENAPN